MLTSLGIVIAGAGVAMVWSGVTNKPLLQPVLDVLAPGTRLPFTGGSAPTGPVAPPSPGAVPGRDPSVPLPPAAGGPIPGQNPQVPVGPYGGGGISVNTN